MTRRVMWSRVCIRHRHRPYCTLAMAGATSSSVCAPCPAGSYSNATGLLRAVKDAVSKLDVVLILLPTVTQPMTSYTKRSLHAVAVTCIAHLTQRGQSRRETTFRVRYSKETNCPTASHLVKSSISNGLIRRDHAGIKISTYPVRTSFATPG